MNAFMNSPTGLVLIALVGAAAAGLLFVGLLWHAPKALTSPKKWVSSMGGLILAVSFVIALTSPATAGSVVGTGVTLAKDTFVSVGDIVAGSSSNTGSTSTTTTTSGVGPTSSAATTSQAGGQ
jgi:hypothetical protein